MSKSAIVQALTTKILGAGITDWINFPNTGKWLKTGSSPLSATPSNQIWLRVNYLFGEQFQRTLKETDELVGIVQIDVFAPKGTSVAATYAIIDKLDACFSRLVPTVATGGIKIYVSSVKPSQPRMSTLSDSDTWMITTFDANIRAMVDKL